MPATVAAAWMYANPKRSWTTSAAASATDVQRGIAFERNRPRGFDSPLSHPF